MSKMWEVSESIRDANLEGNCKSRKMSEVSEETQGAGFDKSPPEPKKGKPDQSDGPSPAEKQPEIPAPEPKTPEDMGNHPDEYLPEDEVTGQNSDGIDKQRL